MNKLQIKMDVVEWFSEDPLMPTDESVERIADMVLSHSDIEYLQKRINELEDMIDTPQTDNWIEAVKLEAAYQIKRWGTNTPTGKCPPDWLWLLGHLASKAVIAFVQGDVEKGKHHIISSSAVLLNWHRNVTGEDTRMRPGMDLRP